MVVVGFIGIFFSLCHRGSRHLQFVHHVFGDFPSLKIDFHLLIGHTANELQKFHILKMIILFHVLMLIQHSLLRSHKHFVQIFLVQGVPVVVLHLILLMVGWLLCWLFHLEELFYGLECESATD